MAMKESQAFNFAFAFLISLGSSGCSPKPNMIADTEGGVESSLPRIVNAKYDMRFVWIPPSGDEWKDECRRRGIVYKPVDAFYLQTRRVSLSQYRKMGGDVGGYTSFPDIDWNQGAIVADWVQAVNWGHLLSNNDAKFDYRLPTIHEWLYAYHYVTSLERSDVTELNFEGVTSGCWEFATDSVLDIPLPIGYEASLARETLRRSFAMGKPYGLPNDALPWSVIANATPPTGDDGIDESTFLRFVLVAKPRRAISIQRFRGREGAGA
jgi:hypothetical protein